MKLVSKFHRPSPSSLGGVRGKPPSGIKSYSFIDCREETNSSHWIVDIFSLFTFGKSLWHGITSEGIEFVMKFQYSDLFLIGK